MRSSDIVSRATGRRTNRDQQTFTKMVGSKVLPDFLSVLFDPTRKKLGATDLNGWYLYDDEGVKARPVRVVENGTLKTFLMSRSPDQGILAIERTWPEAGRIGAGVPAVEPYRRIQQSRCRMRNCGKCWSTRSSGRASLTDFTSSMSQAATQPQDERVSSLSR